MKKMANAAGDISQHWPRRITLPQMPDYWVEPYEPEDILWFQGRQIRLNKVPKQGSWFDLGDGTPMR